MIKSRRHLTFSFHLERSARLDSRHPLCEKYRLATQQTLWGRAHLSYTGGGRTQIYATVYVQAAVIADTITYDLRGVITIEWHSRNQAGTLPGRRLEWEVIVTESRWQTVSHCFTFHFAVQLISVLLEGTSRFFLQPIVAKIATIVISLIFERSSCVVCRSAIGNILVH